MVSLGPEKALARLGKRRLKLPNHVLVRDLLALSVELLELQVKLSLLLEKPPEPLWYLRAQARLDRGQLGADFSAQVKIGVSLCRSRITTSILRQKLSERGHDRSCYAIRLYRF